MPSLRLVLGDQLSRSLSSLEDVSSDDTILMCEVHDEATYVRHHKKKIAFLFSAMRHFAKELQDEGHRVRYVKLNEEDNTGSFTGEVKRALADLGDIDCVVVTEPGEWRLMEIMRGWEDELGIPVEIRNDTRFIASLADFETWADGRKELRLEYFYRELRKRTGILMDGDDPCGGQWNFDKENREPLPRDIDVPERLHFDQDSITQDVIKLVAKRFDNHFGDIEPFGLAVTREQALQVLDHFIEQCLPTFGPYQDAMRAGEPFLFHSLLSFAINCGLLLPREVCDAAEKAYRDGKASINSAEGFVRQVLGWREYVRGLYWLKMPEYKQHNALDATRSLPDFYWTGETDMACMAHAINDTRKHAYAHHIQRLMVTGNFALLAGIDPDAINDWYMVVYADAYEWVELPNVHGMAIFADGGIMASKPYAASGNYIDKMGDYCASCVYDVKSKNGEKACPFNYLYWNFLKENRDVLKGNHRMGMIYRTYDRMSDEKKTAIDEDSQRFLENIV